MKASKQIKKLFRGGMSLKAYARSAGGNLVAAWLANKRRTPLHHHVASGGPVHRATALMCAGGSPHPHVAAGCMFGGGRG